MINISLASGAVRHYDYIVAYSSSNSPISTTSLNQVILDSDRLLQGYDKSTGTIIGWTFEFKVSAHFATGIDLGFVLQLSFLPPFGMSLMGFRSNSLILVSISEANLNDFTEHVVSPGTKFTFWNTDITNNSPLATLYTITSSGINGVPITGTLAFNVTYIVTEHFVPHHTN